MPGLDLLRQCPAKFKAWRDGLLTLPEKRGGRLSHCCLLSPDELKKQYVSCDLKRNSKAFLQMEENHPDVVLISAADMARIQAMREALMLHPAAGALLGGDGQLATSVFWRATVVADALCKCRIDYFNPASGVLVDYRLVDSAAPCGVVGRLRRNRDHVQQSFSEDGCRAAGLEVRRYVFIEQERRAPYLVSAFELDAVWVERGRKAYHDDLVQLHACNHDDAWPGYGDDVRKICSSDEARAV